MLTSWIMSLKWLVFKRTKINFWREVVGATETYVSPPLDEYEVSRCTFGSTAARQCSPPQRINQRITLRLI